MGLAGEKHFENILMNLKVVHCFFSHVLCHEPKSTYKQAFLIVPYTWRQVSVKFKCDELNSFHFSVYIPERDRCRTWKPVTSGRPECLQSAIIVSKRQL